MSGAFVNKSSSRATNLGSRARKAHPSARSRQSSRITPCILPPKTLRNFTPPLPDLEVVSTSSKKFPLQTCEYSFQRHAFCAVFLRYIAVDTGPRLTMRSTESKWVPVIGKRRRRRRTFRYVFVFAAVVQSLTRAQKPKLKVGKTKAKPSNFTDTSFQSKCEWCSFSQAQSPGGCSVNLQKGWGGSWQDARRGAVSDEAMPDRGVSKLKVPWSALPGLTCLGRPQ